MAARPAASTGRWGEPVQTRAYAERCQTEPAPKGRRRCRRTRAGDRNIAWVFGQSHLSRFAENDCPRLEAQPNSRHWAAAESADLHASSRTRTTATRRRGELDWPRGHQPDLALIETAINAPSGQSRNAQADRFGARRDRRQGEAMSGKTATSWLSRLVACVLHQRPIIA